MNLECKLYRIGYKENIDILKKGEDELKALPLRCLKYILLILIKESTSESIIDYAALHYEYYFSCWAEKVLLPLSMFCLLFVIYSLLETTITLALWFNLGIGSSFSWFIKGKCLCEMALYLLLRVFLGPSEWITPFYPSKLSSEQRVILPLTILTIIVWGVSLGPFGNNDKFKKKVMISIILFLTIFWEVFGGTMALSDHSWYAPLLKTIHEYGM